MTVGMARKVTGDAAQAITWVVATTAQTKAPAEHISQQTGTPIQRQSQP